MALSENLGLLEGIATTRAIRRYRAEPISDADMAAMLFAATRAPSGSNRQPARFLVLRNGPIAQKAKALLGNSFRAGWSEKRAADGYEQGSGEDDSSPKSRMARSMQYFVDHFEEAPAVVLPCLRRRHDNLMDGASVYPACQNLLLAARALGYGGVMTGWHAQVEPELRVLLRIPNEFQIAATIPIGVPMGSHGPVRRRPSADVVFDDVWEATASWMVEPEGTRHTQAGPPKS